MRPVAAIEAGVSTVTDTVGCAPSVAPEKASTPASATTKSTPPEVLPATSDME